MDLSIAQILQIHTSKGFRQPFIDNPYLEQVTLREVVSSPFAMCDFLRCCRMLPHCGEVTIIRLCAVIENVAAGKVDQNSGVC